MSSEELKKEWGEFEGFMDKYKKHAGEWHNWDCAFPEVDGANCNCDLPQNKKEIKSFISSLLAEQQDIPMGYSRWLAYGKKFGYHDYWKDMTRIAVEEEFVKMVERMKNHNEMLEMEGEKFTDGYEKALADIKSKLK